MTYARCFYFWEGGVVCDGGQVVMGTITTPSMRARDVAKTVTLWPSMWNDHAVIADTGKCHLAIGKFRSRNGREVWRFIVRRNQRADGVWMSCQLLGAETKLIEAQKEFLLATACQHPMHDDDCPNECGNPAAESEGA